MQEFDYSNETSNDLYDAVDGLSYEEMSETLHKPVKSVDNAIQRIKRKSAAIKPQ